MFISHYNGHGIKSVRPLSTLCTVDNTRDYARVFHSRQLSNSNYNVDHWRQSVGDAVHCG